LLPKVRAPSASPCGAGGVKPNFGQPTATTRWRISALRRWLIELLRCRAGESADFELEACDDAGLRVGMPATKAQALMRGLITQDADSAADVEALERLEPNLSDRRRRLTLHLARQFMGAPRHLSQHPGFVLTHDRLDDLVPIEPAAMVDRQ
jgi:hypothetical protein